MTVKITPASLTRHELIGLETHVVDSTDPSHICRHGSVVDESKEMIHISTDMGSIMVPKSGCVFEFQLPDGEVVRVDGQMLRGTPEDRIKKRQSRSW
ncbi:MAG: ribonuclease P protein component 1 [Candidatus Thorarchaeota archaeon]